MMGWVTTLERAVLLSLAMSASASAIPAQDVSLRSGVRTVEYPDGPGELPTIHVSATPDLILHHFDPLPSGAGGGEPRSVFRIGDSTLVVASAGDGALRAFGPRGASRWVLHAADLVEEENNARLWIGRVHEDTVGIWFPNQGRLVLVGVDGTLEGFNLAPPIDPRDWADGPPVLPRLLGIGALTDGSLVGYLPEVDLDPPFGVRRMTSPIVRYDRDQEVWIPLGLSIGRDLVRPAGARRWAGFDLPFGARGTVTTAGDLVVGAWSDGGQVRLVNADGALSGVLMPNLPRARVTSDDIDRARDEIRNATPLSRRAAVARALGDLPTPDRWPANGRILGGADEIWIQEARALPDGAGRRWFVYSLTGVARGVAVLPDAFNPTDVGSDYVLGILASASGRDAAVMFRLSRTASH